jgi:transcriptional regulator with XRE-family HTH domain
LSSIYGQWSNRQIPATFSGMNTEARPLTGMSGRIRLARQRAGLSAAELARKLGVSRGAVSQWETDIAAPADRNLRNMARLLGVATEWLQTGRGLAAIPATQTALDPMAEGEKIDPRELSPDLARPIMAATTGRSTEVWKLTADKMAGAGYRSGDFVLVDLQSAARARDVVLAEVTGTPIFRLFLPPYLYAAPIGAPEPHLVADQIRIIVRGVVVSRFSFS